MSVRTLKQAKYLAPLVLALALAACGGDSGNDAPATAGVTPTPTPTPTPAPVAAQKVVGYGASSFKSLRASGYNENWGDMSSMTYDGTQGVTAVYDYHNEDSSYTFTTPFALGAASGLTGTLVSISVGAQNKSFHLLDTNTLKSVQNVFWENIDDTQVQGVAVVGAGGAAYSDLNLPSTGTATYAGHAFQVFDLTTSPGYAKVVYRTDATGVFDYATRTMTVTLGANPQFVESVGSVSSADTSLLAIQPTFVFASNSATSATHAENRADGSDQINGNFFGSNGAEFGGALFQQNNPTWAGSPNLVSIRTSFALKKQ